MYMYLTHSIGFDPKELEFQIGKKYRYNFFFLSEVKIFVMFIPHITLEN